MWQDDATPCRIARGLASLRDRAVAGLGVGYCGSLKKRLIPPIQRGDAQLSLNHLDWVLGAGHVRLQCVTTAAAAGVGACLFLCICCRCRCAVVHRCVGAVLGRASKVDTAADARSGMLLVGPRSQHSRAYLTAVSALLCWAEPCPCCWCVAAGVLLNPKPWACQPAEGAGIAGPAALSSNSVTCLPPGCVMWLPVQHNTTLCMGR